jgi:hypothetical protein
MVCVFDDRKRHGPRVADSLAPNRVQDGASPRRWVRCIFRVLDGWQVGAGRRAVSARRGGDDASAAQMLRAEAHSAGDAGSRRSEGLADRMAPTPRCSRATLQLRDGTGAVAWRGLGARASPRAATRNRCCGWGGGIPRPDGRARGIPHQKQRVGFRRWPDEERASPLRGAAPGAGGRPYAQQPMPTARGRPTAERAPIGAEAKRTSPYTILPKPRAGTIDRPLGNVLGRAPPPGRSRLISLSAQENMDGERSIPCGSPRGSRVWRRRPCCLRLPRFSAAVVGASGSSGLRSCPFAGPSAPA